MSQERVVMWSQKKHKWKVLSKKTIAIFGYKQRLLSIEIKTKVAVGKSSSIPHKNPLTVLLAAPQGVTLSSNVAMVTGWMQFLTFLTGQTCPCSQFFRSPAHFWQVRFILVVNFWLAGRVQAASFWYVGPVGELEKSTFKRLDVLTNQSSGNNWLLARVRPASIFYHYGHPPLTAMRHWPHMHQ